METFSITLGGMDPSQHVAEDLCLPIIPDVGAVVRCREALDAAAATRRGLLVVGPKGVGKGIGVSLATQWFADVEKAKASLDDSYVRRKVLRIRDVRDATYRETAVNVARQLASACPTDEIEDWVMEGTALITTSTQEVLDWVQRVQVRPSDRHMDLDRLQASLDHAEAFASIATAIARAPLPESRTIASVRGEGLATFEPLAVEANEINGRSPRHWENQLSGARRSIGPTAGGISTIDRGRMLTWIDRPDALIQMVRDCHLPYMGALMDEAEAILGHVLRDADVVDGWLQKVPLGERTLRNGLVVALGLMGQVPPVGRAWPDPGQPDEAAAYCAAVALAADDESGRCTLADDADMRAVGAAAEIAAKALARVESRCRLGVLD